MRFGEDHPADALSLQLDLPFLARPFTADEVARATTLASQNRTKLEGPVLPIQVLGSGTAVIGMSATSLPPMKLPFESLYA